MWTKFYLFSTNIVFNYKNNVFITSNTSSKFEIPDDPEIQASLYLSRPIYQIVL